MELERKNATPEHQHDYKFDERDKMQSTNKKKRKKTKKEPEFLRYIRKAMKNNPNFNSQLIIVLMTLTSGNVPVDQEIDNLTEAIEKIRHVTEIVDKTMQSVKVATEAPRQIRQLLE